MGPEGAVNIVYKRELDEAAVAPSRDAKIASSGRNSPTRISPARRAISTRSSSPARPGRSSSPRLRMLENKRDKNPPKKHGNIPL